MPFAVISDFAATDQSVPEAGAIGLPLYGAAGQSLADEAGATARAGEAFGQVIVTLADGTEVSSTIDVTDNFSLVPGAAMPIGDGQFVFQMDLAPELNSGVGLSGILLVTFDPASGGVSSTSSLVAPFSNPDEGIGSSLRLFPIGPGMVGYVETSEDVNAYTDLGFITIGATGNPEAFDAVRLGPGSDGFALALPGGGALFVAQEAGYASPADVTLVQVDAAGAVVAFDNLNAFDFTALGIDPEGMFTTLAVDENGDLQVFIENLDADPVEVFAATLDLLPETGVEEPEEPELPEEPVLDDLLEGTDDADDLRGGAGDDAIYGMDGDDFLRGNHDDDEMYGGAGADDMNGGFGDDYIEGGAGDDKIGGFDGADLLYGGEGDDRMHGGRDDDQLFGGDGNDVMRGAEGADTLTGGAGDDLLIGGEGADVFAWEVEMLVPEVEGVVLAAVDNGTDTIKDFVQGEDKIQLANGVETADGPAPALTFEDLFLSQEDSLAIIQAGDTIIQLKGIDAEDLTEEDFIFL